MKRPNRKPAEPGVPAGGKALARNAQAQLARGLPITVPAGTKVAKAPTKQASRKAPAKAPRKP
jgi:hypothetical protein